MLTLLQLDTNVILKVETKMEISCSTLRADTKALTFKIKKTAFEDLSFKSVGNNYANNLDLALWKANRILQNVVKTYTFGTGFPTIVRKSSKTRVDRDWVFY